MEHAIIDNRVYRVYKNLWPSMRVFWLTHVTQNSEVHEKEYLVFEDTRMTYGEADQIVHKLASILREVSALASVFLVTTDLYCLPKVYGVRKGDRVGLSMRNYPEWILTFWAASLLVSNRRTLRYRVFINPRFNFRLIQGAVPTAFNAWLPLDASLHCIRLTDPKVLFLDHERLDLLASVLPSLPIPVVIVRPYNEQRIAGVNCREWSRVLMQYKGPIDAWKKEGEILPDDNATVCGEVLTPYRLLFIDT